MATDTTLRFPPFRLDLGDEQLWKEDELVPLRPKPFAVLRYLVENPGRLVTREELQQSVWPGTYVSESLLRGYVRDLRDALGDDAEAPRFIETIPRRGYRFLAEVASSQYSVASSPPPTLQVSALRTQHSSSLAPSTQHLTPNLVGRETELRQLHKWLTKAASGERQLVFVTGEPGIGKTALVEAFRQRLETRDWRLVPAPQVSSLQPPTSPVSFAHGQCVEHYGAGEAYLPVLEALSRLCRQPGGDRIVEVLKRYAPAWLVQLPALVTDAEFELLQRKVQGAARERMLREFAEALEVLTQEAPLVLVLEDLHWSDVSTLDLLGLVARRREAARLLVIGTYRPADAIVSNHPLRSLKQDLQGRRYCEELALGFLSEPDVDAYLAERFTWDTSAPDTARQLAHFVHRRTDGNPLFMINMLDSWVSQGLLSERQGIWRLTEPVEDQALPESIRQLIEQQLERLSADEQRLLEVASIAGSLFSVATVAVGVDDSIEHIEEGCERLAGRGQFLRQCGAVSAAGETAVSCYGFRHALYQQVLYERLPETRRRRLHQRIGEAEEAACRGRVAERATELARHFEEARDYRRAVQYHAQAAQTALQRSAFPEAIAHLQKGLALVASLADTPERAYLELPLQLTLGAAAAAARGTGSQEMERAFARARVLSQQIGDAPEIFPALIGLSVFYNARAQYDTTTELLARCLNLAKQSRDPASLVMAHLYAGANLLALGDLRAARQASEQGLALWESHHHQFFVSVTGINTAAWAEAFFAWGLWLLGYPDQAVQRSQHAAQVARECGHGNTLATTLQICGNILVERYALPELKALMDEVAKLCAENGIPAYLALSMALQGWGRVMQGEWEDGLVQLRQGVADYIATGSLLLKSGLLGLLADACRTAGRIDEGLAALTEAFAFVEQTGERVYEAELWRLKGELLLQSHTTQRSTRPVHRPSSGKRSGRK